MQRGELNIATQAFCLHADSFCLAYRASAVVDFNKPVLHEQRQYPVNHITKAWNQEWQYEELFHFTKLDGKKKTLYLEHVGTLFDWVDSHGGFIHPLY